MQPMMPPGPPGAPPQRRHPPWTGRLHSATRQLCALVPALGIVALLRLAIGTSPITAWLIGWDVYCGILISLFMVLVLGFDADETARRARVDDPGGFMLFVLVLLGCGASLFAVVFAVSAGHALTGFDRWAHLLLVALSVALSWWLVNVVWALHYARVYYQSSRTGAGAGPSPAEPAGPSTRAGGGSGCDGGLDFPGGQRPDYADFFYFAVVIGMTSQVSDVTITDRRMRLLATTQGMLSFAFNLVILALAVNVLASSLG